MKWIKFDKKIKQDLYNYKSDEDALDIWNAIESDVHALNRKKQRTGSNKIIFLLLFLIGAFSLAYLSMQSEERWPKQSVEKKLSKIKSISVTEQIDIERDNVISKSIINNTPENEILEKKKFKESKTEKTILKPIVTRQDAIGFEVDIFDEINIAATSVKRKSENPKKTQEIFGFRADKINFENPVSIEKRLVNKSPTSLLKIKENSSTLIENRKAISLVKSDDAFRIRNQKVLPPLSIVSLDEILFDNVLILPLPKSSQGGNVNIKTGSKNKFSVGVNTGIYYAIKTIEAKELDELSFEQSRLDTERSLETIHGSIYGAYQFNKRVSISAGLGYTRINEGFTFAEETIEKGLVTGERYVLTGSGVNPTRFGFLGLVEEIETTNTAYTLYNKYELIDIPVFVSYMWNRLKWSYGIQAGVITNLKFKGSGRILESETRSEDISELDILKKSLGISYGLNLVVERRLNSSFSLRLAPSFRYFPSEFTRENYGLRQEYHLLGLDVGLKYNF